MRNFYNVQCPTNKLEYEIVGEQKSPTRDSFTPQNIAVVEMRTHRIIDFGKFIEEELSADGDYFIYSMESVNYAPAHYSPEVLLHFRFDFIPQSRKDLMGWGQLLKINDHPAKITKEKQ